MLERNSKAAEKTYLGRSGGSAWEREKPFSPPGDDTWTDSVALLHDFAVAATLLQPAARDRIIDLGAGGGWCSDLLTRLNRRSIAVDISLEMLRVSRERPTRTPFSAVVGDLEHLPFADRAFDKAICLNALHHVPDMGKAVHEISRVLSRDGVAVFSEPGTGHAAMPASLTATRDFGVLEQEVLIEPFVEMCRAAGFRNVRICPIAYVIPEFELSLEEWRAWKRLPRRKRPLRAMEKMWRAALEFLGAGKRSVLFEEAFAIRLVRLFQQPVEEHPFILAAKSDVTPQGDRQAPYRARIEVRSLPTEARPGNAVTAVLVVSNVGGSVWTASPSRPSTAGQVRVGVQLLDSSARLVVRDFARADLDADVPPNESRTIHLTFAAPAEAGEYVLKFDFVAEGVTWFEPTGSPAETRPFTVR
jgi:demethylmenaquinone methyltransferase/2-methoxy-6-polyprenyl-1,4-benzoquinol methylase